MIHKYQMNGLNIVLDVHSGAVHAVDDIVYQILDNYKGKNESPISVEALAKQLPAYTGAELEEALGEIKQLEQNGLLFAADVSQTMLTQVEQRAPVVKALCLHIAHDCNLKCTYCFAEEGEYRGKRSLMSLEVGKKAIDFLIKSSGNRHNLEVDFFGGEPLMNVAVVKALVAYGRAQEKLFGKTFRFTLTTNGVLLSDELIAFANAHMDNVVLSLDGRKAVNDHMRKRVGGQGSYDTIVPKFQKLAESRNQKNYYVRGTFTRENLDFMNDVLHMADLGFKQLSVEPVVADSAEGYALKEEDLPVLFDQYEQLAVEMLKRKNTDKAFNFFHFMIDLTGGPCVVKRLVGCGAGTEYLAVTPEGDLYPCHQFVGVEAYKLGHVDTGVQNVAQVSAFEACNVYAKKECVACWAKFYCSGGCAANGFFTHGDILKPYALGCELQRKRTECAIMMKVAEMAEA